MRVVLPYPAAARACVDEVILLDHSADGSASGPWRVWPDGASYLLVHAHCAGDDPKAWDLRTSLVGPRSVFRDVDRTGRGGTLAIRLRAAGVATLTALPLREWVDRAEHWSCFVSNDGHSPGPDRGDTRVRPSRSNVAETLRQVAEVALERLSATPRAVPPAALHAVRLMDLHRLDGRPTIRRAEEIAATVGVSSRYLRQLFAKYVGLTPKRYMRVQRVRATLAAARTRPFGGWAALAARYGYVDQSHLIAEFQELLGGVPDDVLHRLLHE